MADKMTEYQKFFMKAMEKFGVNSPSDFKTDAEKKKFFNYIDKEWKGEKSEDFEIHGKMMTEANAFLKARAVAIWEGSEEFEFNGKIYPVIKVQQEIKSVDSDLNPSSLHDYLLEYGSKTLGAGDIRYEGIYRRLSKESFKWYKNTLGSAIQSRVASMKEFDSKTMRKSIIKPESDEDLKNAFKFIRKFITTTKHGGGGEFRRSDLNRLEEIISEFGIS